MATKTALLPGLTLPFLSAADPDIQAEGSIDPLGLATLGDRLADEIAPGVTARMTRPRLVTAIAVAAAITEPYADQIASDGVTPAWLATEWHLVEALVRFEKPDGGRRVPGSDKTRVVLDRKSRLDTKSYLKSAKTFGYHGIFKRLAVDLRVVDDSLALTERGRELVRTWEQEQQLDGFLDGVTGEGNELRRTFARALSGALIAGEAQSISKHAAERMADALRVGDAGRRERRLLWGWLVDHERPMRREILEHLRTVTGDQPESDILRALRPNASPELATRLEAIEAYERLSTTLTRAFDGCRVLGRRYGTLGFTIDQAATEPAVAEAANTVDQHFADAVRTLEPLGLASRLEMQLATMHASSPKAFVEWLFAHHEAVQAAKPPTGKRPWFERIPNGFIVRSNYGLDDQIYEPDAYVHPMRVGALRTFCQDLR